MEVHQQQISQSSHLTRRDLNQCESAMERNYKKNGGYVRFVNVAADMVDIEEDFSLLYENDSAKYEFCYLLADAYQVILSPDLRAKCCPNARNILDGLHAHIAIANDMELGDDEQKLRALCDVLFSRKVTSRLHRQWYAILSIFVEIQKAKNRHDQRMHSIPVALIFVGLESFMNDYESGIGSYVDEQVHRWSLAGFKHNITLQLIA